MKIAFVQFRFYEYLGVMYLSAALKSFGHTCDVFICKGKEQEAEVIRDLARYRPDMVAFSVMTGNEEMALEIACRLKQLIPVFSVFGGPHPTAFPEMITMPGVDSVCLGEAEESLTAIADTLEAGKTPRDIHGAWFNLGGTIIRNDAAAPVQNLDSLRRPDHALYRDKFRLLRVPRASFIAGRGCPYECTFCSNPNLIRLYKGKGAFVRQRSVADVIGEILEVKRDYGIRAVMFEDETFIVNAPWTLAFCETYRREVGLPFSCHIRADLVTDEIVAALASANCRTVSFGIESGDSQKRSSLLGKEITDEQILNCAIILRKHGIRFRTLNILGLPGETLEEAWRTVALNALVKPDFPWCALFQPMPATELWNFCKEKDLFARHVPGTNPTFFKSSPLALAEKTEIENLHKFFIYAVKFPALQKLICRILSFKPNIFYEALFLLAHSWVYFRSSLTPVRELVSLGLTNIARYLPRDMLSKERHY